MILEYLRPDSLAQVLNLIARQTPLTYPMGGGTKLNKPSKDEYAVVDLQALAADPEIGMGQVNLKGNTITIGAAVKLSNVLEIQDLPEALRQATYAETGINIRATASIAGTLVSADGCSPLTAALLAMDTSITWISQDDQEKSISLGELLLQRRNLLPGKLILAVQVPTNVRLCYQVVNRTPKDFPIVLAATCIWPSGRTRVVLGGFGREPSLVFDGPDAAGVTVAACEAYKNAGDTWAGAEYRSTMAELLTRRCLEQLADGG